MNRHQFAAALAVGLALTVAGPSWPGGVTALASAQESTPCTLLSNDEIKPLAEKASITAGVANSVPSAGFTTCRYAWGEGIDRFRLVVAVTDAVHMFPGMTPDQIKQRLLASVRAETDDAVISEVGEAAVFKPESFVYAVATALVKGRILQVQLDGRGALEKKDQVIGLLKSAVMRL